MTDGYTHRVQRYVFSVVKEYTYSGATKLVGTEATYDKAADLYDECGGSSVQNDYHGTYKLRIKESWETVGLIIATDVA